MPNLLRTAFTLLLILVGITGARAVIPYTQATVTRLQNTVSYGDSLAQAKRPAQTGDTIKANNYLLTETDSRAELKYQDGSIVRIGQNTVFTFEADTRTLNLQKGSLIFYIPKGQGGGTVRTASITAAITGTIGKVADNMIAILEGAVRLVPSGRIVSAGYFAMSNPDGSITIERFDPERALGGKLMDFGGKIADFDEQELVNREMETTITRDIMEKLETIDRTQNQPGAQRLFNPPDAVTPQTRVVVPPPTSTPGTPNNGQY